MASDAPNAVTIIANYIPFEDPAGGPNYYRFDPTVVYGLKVDNNGDARTDVSYEFRFKTTVTNPNTFLYNTGPINAPTAIDPDLNVKQTYSVTRVSSGKPLDGAGLEPAGAADQHRATLESDVRHVPGRQDSRRRPQGVRRAA